MTTEQEKTRTGGCQCGAVRFRIRGALGRPSDKRGMPGVGQAAGGSADRWRTPRQTVEFINALQKWAMEGTRLGIPVLVHEESLHGYMASYATMFPQAIALAGTFDRDLMRRVQSLIAREVRSRGTFYVLSPVVDIARDPRWGRIEETFGEDPYLVSEMGVAAVEGLQGQGKFERLGPDRVFATLKHFTGHGQPDSGTNAGPSEASERELETLLSELRATLDSAADGMLVCGMDGRVRAFNQRLATLWSMPRELLAAFRA